MEAKKNPEVNLERKRGLFLQIGLVVSLLLVLVAFEYKSYEKTDYSLGQLQMDDLEEEIIPITKQEVKPPPPPPPPPEVIEIVEDEVEIENEIEIEDTESDEDEEIEIEEEDDEEFFMVVENMPEFPGGDLGLMKYIQKNVKYPAIAKEYNITGKVYVSFIVDKSGKVTNVKIVRGVDKNLDAEAVRVVKSLPKYKPGKQRGKAVRVMFTIPINFTLN
jgi:protein TonB